MQTAGAGPSAASSSASAKLSLDDMNKAERSFAVLVTGLYNETTSAAIAPPLERPSGPSDVEVFADHLASLSFKRCHEVAKPNTLSAPEKLTVKNLFNALTDSPKKFSFGLSETQCGKKQGVKAVTTAFMMRNPPLMWEASSWHPYRLPIMTNKLRPKDLMPDDIRALMVLYTERIRFWKVSHDQKGDAMKKILESARDHVANQKLLKDESDGSILAVGHILWHIFRGLSFEQEPMLLNHESFKNVKAWTRERHVLKHH